MINFLWKTSDSLDHQLPTRKNRDDSLLSRLGLRTVLLFCSNRVWRGGPRLLAQVLGFILTVLIIFRILPDYSGGGFHKSYKDIFSWSSVEIDRPIDLRIVVFGSPDIVGSAVDSTKKRTTWTEQLCNEMKCSSHISLVPSGDNSHGVTSNSIYAEEFYNLQNITAKTNITEKPALDYQFLAEQYPVPWETPDLETQITQFLAMPPPKVVPRETLWVFTFGTWDIWNLAAMPKTSGEGVVEALAAYTFSQVERLYINSLNPQSVAFSDFWSNATEQEVGELTAPDAAANVDVRKLENFRVVLPKLFDISLTPGWKSRPVPPFPQLLSEQTRKAAVLTKLWNAVIEMELEAWKELAGTKPKEVVAEESSVVEVPKTKSLLQYLPASLQPQKAANVDEQGEPIIYAPYPRRNGYMPNQAGDILDAMTEEEMQRGGVWDSQGRGFVSQNSSMRFLNIWEPCVTGYAEDLSVDLEETSAECELPGGHLFYDAFTVSQRAIEGLAKKIAKGVVDELFLRNYQKSGWWFYRSRRSDEESPKRLVRR